MPVTVRFAPSPTGLLHIGALRTVLFDDLLRRKEGGRLILRLEDTDRSRFDPASEAEFVSTLRWVGIEFDEGPHVGGPHAPYRQSERADAGIYRDLVAPLLASGALYRAFETPEEIEEMREMQRVNHRPVGYFGGAWRDADEARIEAALRDEKPFVVRLKVPRGRNVVVEDAIRGRVEFDSDLLPDPILIKADGMPTYHLAAMADDHLMEVTHIIRGEEWIASSPIHALVFEAFGWEPPVFCHCPVILGRDGKKLSKRHGATRVLDYMAQGFLPAALRNFVALIGWSPGDDREVMDDAELVAAFSFAGLQPSPGHFDLDKLRWLNGHHLRRLSVSELRDALFALDAEPYFREYHERAAQPDESPEEYALRASRYSAFRRLVAALRETPELALAALELEQERVLTLVEFGEACDFFWNLAMDEKARAKWLAVPHAAELLRLLLARLDETPNEVSGWETALRGIQAELGLEKLGPVVHPVRVALTGKTTGPGLFELMAALGPQRMRPRLDAALPLQDGG